MNCRLMVPDLLSLPDQLSICDVFRTQPPRRPKRSNLGRKPSFRSYLVVILEV